MENYMDSALSKSVASMAGNKGWCLSLRRKLHQTRDESRAGIVLP